MSGAVYVVGAAIGSVAMLALAIWFASKRSNERARLLFLASITYLPLLWILLLVDR